MRRISVGCPAPLFHDATTHPSHSHACHPHPSHRIIQNQRIANCFIICFPRFFVSLLRLSSLFSLPLSNRLIMSDGFLKNICTWPFLPLFYIFYPSYIFSFSLPPSLVPLTIVRLPWCLNCPHHSLRLTLSHSNSPEFLSLHASSFQITGLFCSVPFLFCSQLIYVCKSPSTNTPAPRIVIYINPSPTHTNSTHRQSAISFHFSLPSFFPSLCYGINGYYEAFYHLPI